MRSGPPQPGLFRDIVLAPDRELVPDAAPIVSWRPDDDPEFLREIDRRAQARVRLERRGVDHGHWAVLEPRGLTPPNPRRRRREALRSERWHAARPILLAGAVGAPVRHAGAQGGVLALADRLREPDGLSGWLHERRSELEPGFRITAARAELLDRERDVARVELAGPGGAPLWIKVGRLSTFAGDRSLRMRFSFGREGDDDASSDEARHEQIARLAEALLPEAAALRDEPTLAAAIEPLVGGPVRLTQHIAYWNAPQGGARFHHDAFDEAGAEPWQRGVCYVQLAGRTAWLALSIEDLAARVRELFGWLVEGDMPWLREELFMAPGSFDAARGLVSDRSALSAELALPDCGRLDALVNRGPELTSYLADAGHALVLSAGDALLLPNHGLARTAMHSVFCASPGLTFGISTAIRRQPPEDRPDDR